MPAPLLSQWGELLVLLPSVAGMLVLGAVVFIAIPPFSCFLSSVLRVVIV